MIAVLTRSSDIEALGPEWEALWQRSQAATPFQSPRWLLPWWNHFGTGLPLVATRRRNGHLVGLLPLYVYPQEAKILPIGAGTTDYIDAIGDPCGLLGAALEAAGTHSIGVCDLIDVRPESGLLHASVGGWHASWDQSTACPVLGLSEVAKSARRKLRMNRHRAERIGGWHVTTSDAASLGDGLDALERLHQARWRSQECPGDDRRLFAFLREAAAELLGGGLLRLKRLQVGGETVAAIVALLAADRIFFYLSGFDESFAFISPGTILLGDMLEQAIEERRTEAHFLRGRESYKYRWGAVDRFNYVGRLHRTDASAGAAI